MPEKHSDLAHELSTLANKIKAYEALTGFGIALETLIQKAQGADWFLIVSDSKTLRLRARGYSNDKQEEAYAEYLKLEEENLGNANIQIALVSVDSVSELRTAYPNYYFDSMTFLALLERMSLIETRRNVSS